MQVFGLLGIVPVVLLGYMFGSEQVLFNLKEVVLQLLVLIYLSEMIVLHHRAKSLNYFYPDARPKNLLARRTIPSVFVSILLPIIFAIFCSPWVLWLQEEAHGWYFWVGVGLSLLGLGFPLYCNNYLLGVAEKHEWIDQTRLELKGAKWLWKLAGVSIVAFALVTLPYCDIYTKKYGEVSNLAQTSVKKLNEGNVPPRP